MLFSFLADTINDGNNQGNEKNDWDDNDGNDPTKDFAIDDIVWVEGKIVALVKTDEVVLSTIEGSCITF